MIVGYGVVEHHQVAAHPETGFRRRAPGQPVDSAGRVVSPWPKPGTTSSPAQPIRERFPNPALINLIGPCLCIPAKAGIAAIPFLDKSSSVGFRDRLVEHRLDRLSRRPYPWQPVQPPPPVARWAQRERRKNRFMG